MEIILLERVEKLGQMGDVVKVKPGYARNFLLPRRKALRATKNNRARFESERAQLEAINLERRAEAQAVAAKTRDISVVIIRQAGDSGQLYGSVSGRDISDAVTAAGLSIERRQVQISDKFKTLGLHKVQVSLHPEVSIEVTVNIARSEEEARIQSSGGTIGFEPVDELEEEEDYGTPEFDAGRAGEESAAAAAPEEDAKAER